MLACRSRVQSFLRSTLTVTAVVKYARVSACAQASPHGIQLRFWGHAVCVLEQFVCSYVVNYCASSFVFGVSRVCDVAGSSNMLTRTSDIGGCCSIMIMGGSASVFLFASVADSSQDVFKPSSVGCVASPVSVLWVCVSVHVLCYVHSFAQSFVLLRFV